MRPAWDTYILIERDIVGSPKLSEPLIAALKDLIMSGNTRANSARVLGLSRATLSVWLKRGVEDVQALRPTLHAKLAMTVDVAEGEQERKLVGKIISAALDDVSDGSVALKIMERRNPEDWAPAVADLGGVDTQYVGMSRYALREEAKRVLAAVVGETKKLPGEVVSNEGVKDGETEEDNGTG